MGRPASLLYALLLATVCNAQTDEMRQRYEEFRLKARGEYADFRTKANREYAEFMKAAWQKYSALPPEPKPKDETVPPVVMPDDDKDKPIDSNPVPIKDVVEPPAPEPQPEPISPIEEKPQPVEEYASCQFFGTECKVRFAEDDKFRLKQGDNDALAEAWTRLSGDEYDNLVADCIRLRDRLKLGDWAYLNMLVALSKACLGEGDEATLMTAFVYSQSGYKMRIGRAEGRLCILFASKHSIYERIYYNIDGEKFYPLNCNAEEMEVCSSAFPEEKPLSLYLPQRQQFDFSETLERKLTSERYVDMSFKVGVNKNLIDFYDTYPTSEADGNFMTRWAIYANTPMDENVTENLYPEIKKKINGLNQKGAVNKILNWVQTAFVYEYDDKVWGHDRAFFAEETLFYPYCDCEDRSILFTRLVRDLLNLKCILIYYPGHLAAAVGFTENVEGDYITLGNDRYTVCDPTYIGAPVGRTMPDMDNKSASVILLE